MICRKGTKRGIHEIHVGYFDQINPRFAEQSCPLLTLFGRIGVAPPQMPSNRMRKCLKAALPFDQGQSTAERELILKRLK
jgi:hypothetical protein